MTGLPLIIAFVAAIVIMIVMSSKLRIHPFISIMLVALALGLVAGIPLIDHKLADGTMQYGLATVIGQGFSGTFTSIGIVIILGAMIGTVLEKTGGALKLADMMIRLVGKDNPVLAVQLMGWVVSIPVFCDSGFVILDPIRKALVRRTAASAVAMTFALSSGLFISHVFIPPTPGPIAAASTLGIGDYLLQVIGLGMLCSIFPLIAGYFYARWIGARIRSKDEVNPEEVAKVYNDLIASYGKLPSAFSTLAPIIVPILLMALSSVAAMAGMTGSGAEVIRFLGTPIIARGRHGVRYAAALLRKPLRRVLCRLQQQSDDGRPHPLHHGGGRCARQSDRKLGYGQLYCASCRYFLDYGHLLPIPARSGPKDGTGFLDRRPHHNGGHRCADPSRPRIQYADRDHARLHGDRCGRNDCLACKRLVFLGGL